MSEEIGLSNVFCSESRVIFQRVFVGILLSFLFYRTSFSALPVVEHIRDTPVDRENFPEFCRGFPMTFGVTEDGGLVIVGSPHFIWMDGKKYFLSLPMHCEMRGNLKVSANGEYVACVVADKVRSYVLRWKLRDILASREEARRMPSDQFPIEQHIWISQISRNGDVKISSDRFSETTHDRLVLVGGEGGNDGLMSLKPGDIESLYPFYEFYEGGRTFLWRRDANEKRMAPCSVESGSTADVVLAEGNQYYVWDVQRRCYVQGAAPDSVKDIFFKRVCNNNREILYLAYDSERKLCLFTYELSSGVCNRFELPEQVVSFCVDYENFQPLGDQRSLFLVRTNGEQRQRFFLLDVSKEVPKFKSCEKWLEKLGQKKADEFIEDIFYTGPGDGIKSGTYIVLLIDSSRTKYRLVKIHFYPAIQKLQSPGDETGECWIPCGTVREENQIAAYKKKGSTFISAILNPEGTHEELEDVEWRAVSGDGQYIVGTYRPTEETRSGEVSLHAPLVGYLRTPVTDIQLDPLEDASSCEVFGVHSTSPRVVGESTFLDGKVQACMWLVNVDPRLKEGYLGGQVVPLQVPQECKYSSARAISEDREVIVGQVGYPDARKGYRACCWKVGTFQELPYLDRRHNFSMAHHVVKQKKNTLIVGQSGVLISGCQIDGKACLWVNDVAYALSRSNDVSSSVALWIARKKGWVVGVYGGIHYRKAGVDGGKAFIYCGQKKGMQDLKIWLSENFVGLREKLVGWTLEYPTWISPDGTVILGVGTYRGVPCGFKVDLHGVKRLTSEADDGKLPGLG